MTEGLMSPVPNDSPLMQAWLLHKASDEYKNSVYWAKMRNVTGWHPHLEGSLWAIFSAGFEAGLRTSGQAQEQAGE